MQKLSSAINDRKSAVRSFATSGIFTSGALQVPSSLERSSVNSYGTGRRNSEKFDDTSKSDQLRETTASLEFRELLPRESLGDFDKSLRLRSTVKPLLFNKLKEKNLDITKSKLFEGSAKLSQFGDITKSFQLENAASEKCLDLTKSRNFSDVLKLQKLEATKSDECKRDANQSQKVAESRVSSKLANLEREKLQRSKDDTTNSIGQNINDGRVSGKVTVPQESTMTVDNIAKDILHTYKRNSDSLIEKDSLMKKICSLCKLIDTLTAEIQGCDKGLIMPYEYSKDLLYNFSNEAVKKLPYSPYYSYYNTYREKFEPPNWKYDTNDELSHDCTCNYLQSRDLQELSMLLNLERTYSLQRIHHLERNTVAQRNQLTKMCKQMNAIASELAASQYELEMDKKEKAQLYRSLSIARKYRKKEVQERNEILKQAEASLEAVLLQCCSSPNFTNYEEKLPSFFNSKLQNSVMHQLPSQGTITHQGKVFDFPQTSYSSSPTFFPAAEQPNLPAGSQLYSAYPNTYSSSTTPNSVFETTGNFFFSLGKPN